MKSRAQYSGLSTTPVLALLLFIVLSGSCCKMDEHEYGEDYVTYQDRLFMDSVAIANLQCIDAGELSLKQNLNSPIAPYVLLFVEDYTTAHKELKTIVTDLGRALPDSTSADYQMRKNELVSLSGRSFDTAWLSLQIASAQEIIAAMETERSKGNNVRMKSYASTYLPRTRRHLQIADSLIKTY